MDYLADIIASIAAVGAGAYCLILSRRISRFHQLEGGMGTAVAILSAQVDDLTKALENAQASAGQSADRLSGLTIGADAGAKRLELLLAAMHEMPSAADARPRRRVVRRRMRAPFTEDAA